MGRGGKMSEKLKIGSLVYYTSKTIAWLIKPENAGDLWSIGLLIDYKSNNMCTILNNNGEYQLCPYDMIMEYNPTQVR